MSSQSTARNLPHLGASPVEQAAELVEDFVLQRTLETLAGLNAASKPAESPQALGEAFALAASLTEQSRLVDEEIARYLEVRQAD